MPTLSSAPESKEPIHIEDTVDSSASSSTKHTLPGFGSATMPLSIEKNQPHAYPDEVRRDDLIPLIEQGIFMPPAGFDRSRMFDIFNAALDLEKEEVSSDKWLESLTRLIRINNITDPSNTLVLLPKDESIFCKLSVSIHSTNLNDLAKAILPAINHVGTQDSDYAWGNLAIAEVITQEPKHTIIRTLHEKVAEITKKFADLNGNQRLQDQMRFPMIIQIYRQNPEKNPPETVYHQTVLAFPTGQLQLERREMRPMDIITFIEEDLPLF